VFEILLVVAGRKRVCFWVYEFELTSFGRRSSVVSVSDL